MLRYNPLLGTWTMVAAHRQQRPHLPKDYCPFCPGSGKVPDFYEVLKYDNDFPALSTNPEEIILHSFYQAAPSYGHCEVILYSSDHQASLYQLSSEHLLKLARLWKERWIALSQDPNVKYVFIFENRGEEVGVTMHHPHGQIYAYSWVPLKIEQELSQCLKWFQQYQKPLILEITQAELLEKKRVITVNNHFAAFIPYFTDYPYGVFITPLQAKNSLADMQDDELMSLGNILKDITGAFDYLFERPFPYMMCFHQIPVNIDADVLSYYHFHIEFYTPLRAKDKIKWYASSEMGAWAAANTRNVEECAEELRLALKRFKSMNES
ncbi:MAG: galactose-1-phosphate uridylyltransferase [Flavobacteriales bacterium]|nr:galactose-1-phosphate uridylyltransferase [Flavobacteriales bacterium]